jgi:nucleoid-associated protein YgaU
MFETNCFSNSHTREIDQEEDRMQKATLQLSVRLAMLIASVCTVFLLIGGSAGAEAPLAPPVEYVVEAGDTLWDIAAQHSAPGADVRRLVSDIKQLNEASSTIVPGQVLLIPAA